MNARPHILFLSYSRPGGGPVSFLARGCNYLSRVADVTLIDEVPAGITVRLEGAARTSVRVIEAPVWTASGAAARVVDAVIAEHPPDWIVVNNPGMFLKFFGVARRARRAHGTRLQMTLHSGMLTPTARRLLLELIASAVLPWADRVTCVSAYTRDHFQRRYPWSGARGFEVIHHGVALPETAGRRSRAPLRVGFVGRLIGEKDPILFAQVARESRREGRPFEFHVYGEGPMAKEMEAHADGTLRFHGHPPSPEVIFAGLDVLMFTSPVENCPNALLEGKSWGVPTVSAPVGGIPELIQHGVDGMLAADRGVRALLRALDGTRAAYEQLSAGCLSSRQRFSLESHASAMWKPILGTPARYRAS